MISGISGLDSDGHNILHEQSSMIEAVLSYAEAITIVLSVIARSALEFDTEETGG
jgi:hypothetical protein